MTYYEEYQLYTTDTLMLKAKELASRVLATERRIRVQQANGQSTMGAVSALSTLNAELDAAMRVIYERI